MTIFQRDSKVELKMSTVSTLNVDHSARSSSSGANVEQIGRGTKFVVPGYWIDPDDRTELIFLKINLSDCSKDSISIMIWNWKQLVVRAACRFHQYKFQYTLPPGARMLFPPKFAGKTGILTCRLSGFKLTCAVCHTSSPTRPLVTKGTSGNLLNGPSVKFVEPRHWVTYDVNAAFFEAHLEGCKSSSQINFHIANDKVIILAVLSPQLHYFLDLRLESSAESNWNAYFDQKVEMFTCSIPLLGHYECGRCMAKRHLNAEGTYMERAEKSVGTQMKEATFGYRSYFNGHSDGNQSRMKAYAYRETEI